MNAYRPRRPVFSCVVCLAPTLAAELVRHAGFCAECDHAAPTVFAPCEDTTRRPLAAASPPEAVRLRVA